MKSSQSRFYCTRNTQIKKNEVISWFNEVNKGKNRQKYWYYKEIYYDINNWPFNNSKDKINKKRIWQQSPNRCFTDLTKRTAVA